MATKPPITGDVKLDEFLSWVFRNLDDLSTRAKPDDGWALTDLQTPVSEVIGDKRDLIEIVDTWQGSAVELLRWEQLAEQQFNNIRELKDFIEKITGHSETFEDVMMWWNLNWRTIHDVQEYAATIDENLEEVISTAGNIRQISEHIDSQRQATDLASSNAAASAQRSDSNATKTGEDRTEVARLLVETQTAETSAKSARDETLDSEGRTKTLEEQTLAYRNSTSELRNLVSDDKDDVASMKQDAEDAAARSEAGANTVGNAEVVLEARTRSVAAQGAAETAANTATSKATVATQKASDAEGSATTAKRDADIATEKASQTAEDRLAVREDRIATEQSLELADDAKDVAVTAAQTATSQAEISTTEATRSKGEADRAEQIADTVDAAATTAAIDAVNDRVNQLLQDAPEAFDTLKEVADKLADQDDAIAALIAQIAVAAQKAAWDQISGKPSTYPPSSHEHTTAQVNGLDAAITSATQNKATISQMNARGAIFTGNSAPPSSIPGAVVGDVWLDTTDPKKVVIHKITGV